MGNILDLCGKESPKYATSCCKGISSQETLPLLTGEARGNSRLDPHPALGTSCAGVEGIVQALFLERRQHCRVQIIEGPNGELMDREKFELEHLIRCSRFRSDLLRS
jgi:hypothetical protein